MRGSVALLMIAMTVLWSVPASAQNDPAPDPLAPLPESPTAPGDAARSVLDWIKSSRDNGELPIIIIDKVAAEALVFDAKGEPLGQTPVLIGSAAGDDSVPGIGERELRAIPPQERTTPAGRFIARFGPAAGHAKVIWVDWPTAVSLHPVVTANRKEHRLERLASLTPNDNRITSGCINVPKRFYGDVIAPLFADRSVAVYILPEVRSLGEVFGIQDRAKLLGSAQ